MITDAQLRAMEADAQRMASVESQARNVLALVPELRRLRALLLAAGKVKCDPHRWQSVGQRYDGVPVVECEVCGERGIRP